MVLEHRGHQCVSLEEGRRRVLKKLEQVQAHADEALRSLREDESAQRTKLAQMEHLFHKKEVELKTSFNQVKFVCLSRRERERERETRMFHFFDQVYNQLGLRRDALRSTLSNERDEITSSIGRRLTEIEQRARGLERTKERAQQLMKEPSSSHFEWVVVPDLEPYSTKSRITFALDQGSIDNALNAIERIRVEGEVAFPISFFASLI
jgi:hypothetical protein